MRFAAAALTLLAVTAAPTPALAHNYDGRWSCLAHYESTHRWHLDAYHDGGLSFTVRTWRAYTGHSAPDYAWQASRRFQIKVAKRVAWKGFYRHGPQGGSSAWPNTWGRCPS